MADESGGKDVRMSPEQRLSRARDLVDAIHTCDPEDAERIMSIILEEWRTGAPGASFLDATSDAAFWARTASFDDLRAVFLAAGQKLARYRLGPRGRIRMVRRLLEDLDGDERRRILEELSGR
ncbi:hypothetical protein [Paracoccus marinaquae]|uniref:Uncharacterized protein n=1 Tax=Paracoccus marinaquae TaxID=2841926 RepID=A0ABS6AMB6_9RHOB|nr:hypothetical protein [Paracoccus marinaquae]MBU3031741.1 hypothetical protein [Paracoccus marinaquae]